MSAPTVATAPEPRPVPRSVQPVRLSRAQIAEKVGDFGIDAYSLASRTGGVR